MAKISWWRYVLAAVIYTAVAFVVHVFDGILGMRYYKSKDYFCVWSKLMMPAAGTPPASFYFYSLLFTLIAGLLFVIVYAVIRKGIPAKGKGAVYGLLVFLVAGIPGSLMTLLVINVPLALAVMWAVESLIIYVVAGITTTALVK